MLPLAAGSGSTGSPFWKRSPVKRPAGAVPGTLTQSRGPPRATTPSLETPSRGSSSSVASAVNVPSTPSTPSASASSNNNNSNSNSNVVPSTPSNDSSAAPLSREQQKRRRLESVLRDSHADLEQLRKLGWSGIPRDLRPAAWRLLLGCAAAHAEKREALLERRREEYRELVPEYDRRERSEYESQMLRQIQRDVPRPHLQHASLQTPKMQNCLCRMLFLWSLRHPVVGFVQGFNDLASVFFSLYLMEKVGDEWEQPERVDALSDAEMLVIEADTFWSLSKLIDGMQDVYTNERRGLFRMLDTITLVVSKVDPNLAKHFEQENIQYNLFAIPWINCLLLRSFPLEMVWRLYDTYFSEGDIARFHPYVCAAFLTTFADKLKRMDFQEALMFIQNPPTNTWTNSDMELLLSQAFMYSSLWGKKT